MLQLFSQQPHKNQMLQGYANRAEKKRPQSSATAKPALGADGAKIAASRRVCAQKLQRTPQVNSRRVASRATLPTDACSSDAALWSERRVIHSAESCVGLRTKERGGDSLSRKEPPLPEREHSGGACVIPHENSDRTH